MNVNSITTVLSRFRTIKNTYEYGRRKASESYRRALRYGSPGQYPGPKHIEGDEVEYRFSNDGIGRGDLDLVAHPDADNPVLTREDVDDCWARFVADPFVVYADGYYHMFFEIKSMGGHVFIGHAYSEDGVNYDYNRIVVQPEVAQHTYPYVFKLEGKWLMVPSPGSNVNGQFRVYEATDFPTEWRLTGIPIREGVRLDPTPIKWGDCWYLIYQKSGSYDVVLEYADSLIGDWSIHPSSPVFSADRDRIAACSIGSAEMVPSGRPLYVDGNVHLFYRSHSERQVYHYRITELSETTFEQEPYGETPVFADREPQTWNHRFMHTVNPVYPWAGTENVVAVDGLEADRYRWSIGVFAIESPPITRL